MTANGKLGQVLPGVAKWAGGGAGAMAVYFAFDLLKAQPALASQVLGWVGMFSLGVIGILLLDKRASQFVEVQRHGAVSIAQSADAMRGLTDAVNAIARKDNEQMIRQEALLEEVVDRTRRIVHWIDGQEK